MMEHGGELLNRDAVRADDVGAVKQKSLTDQRHVTLAAQETLVVPVTIVERRELRCRRTCTKPTTVASQNSWGPLDIV